MLAEHKVSLKAYKTLKIQNKKRFPGGGRWWQNKIREGKKELGLTQELTSQRRITCVTCTETKKEVWGGERWGEVGSLLLLLSGELKKEEGCVHYGHNCSPGALGNQTVTMKHLCIRVWMSACVTDMIPVNLHMHALSMQKWNTLSTHTSTNGQPGLTQMDIHLNY